MSKKAMYGLCAAALGAGVVIVIVWLSGQRHPTDSLESRAQARRQLDRGLALFEIAKQPEDWNQTQACFENLRTLAPDEPAGLLGLAAVAFRQNRHEDARSYLEKVRGHSDAGVAARVEFYLGQLAYAAGDATEVIAANERAFELDPDPVYAYSLAEANDAEGHEQARLRALDRASAAGREPNVMIDISLALLLVQSADAQERRRGLDLLDAAITACLAPPRYRASGDGAEGDRQFHDKLTAFMDKARPDVLSQGGKAPTPLKIATNLLKGTTRFQFDSRTLTKGQQVVPLNRFVGDELSALEPTTAENAKLINLRALPALPGPLTSLGVVDDAEDAPSMKRAVRGAGLLALSGDLLFWLARDVDTWQPVAVQLPPQCRQIVTGDLDGDGLMEAVVIGGVGLIVLDRDSEGAWAGQPDRSGLATAGGFEHAVLTDHNHDGFLDLLALAAGGEATHNLVMFRNREEGGLGPGEPFPMEAKGTWERIVSGDLDLDGDQDLLLAGASGLTQVTNHRRELFAAQQIRALPPIIAGLEAADLNGDGYPEAVVVADGALLVLVGGHGGVTGTALPVSPVWSDGLRLRSVGIADLDLNGALDIVVGGDPDEDGRPSLHVLQIVGGELLAGGILVEAQSHRNVAGLVPLELSGDHAVDLLVWNPSGEILTHGMAGIESQGWVELRLRAPPQIVAGVKVPYDAKGVRIEIYSAAGKHVIQTRRPNLVVGLGEHSPHLIRMIWPNGMSEFLFDPRLDSIHEILLEIRLEGSCPYLYAWNGERYEFVTDVLGISPLGMQVAPHVYNSLHPEEYLRLPGWIEERDGHIELSLTEELREVTYLDQLELVAVDTPADVLAYNGERFVMPPVEGLDLQLLGALSPLAAATSDDGTDALEILRDEDHRYLTNHSGRTRYQGLVNTHTLTLDLGDTARTAQGRVAMLLVGWLQWGNTSTNVAIGHDPSTDFLWPRLEVPDGDGGWRTTKVQLGLPAGKPKWVALDLTGEIDPADPRVRIVTNLEVYWDRIAVAEVLGSAATSRRVQRLAPNAADYFYGGYSRWYRPAPNGPDLFDYSERRVYPWRNWPNGDELRCAFDELEGFYVDYGPVVDLIAVKDDLSLTLGAGEEVRVSFDISGLELLPEGWRRTWFLHSEGWDKDGDFNTAHGQTLGPLPFHSRKAYPSNEPFPDTPAHARYLEERLTRWVSRDRLIKLVTTAPPLDQD